MKLLLLLASVIGMAVGASHANAAPASQQDFPARPIRLIVAQAPGGGSDATARIVARQLERAWGQSVVVDNRPGATSIIGFDLAAKSAPDGYTWLFGDVGSVSIVPSLYPKLPFDPEKDFIPVATLVRLPYVLVASNDLPVKTVADVVALAKAKPGSLTYASAGAGGINHLLAEMFSTQAGVKMVHVPFRGSGAAVTALIGGHVQLYFAGVSAVMPLIKQGAVRAIAVTSATRLAGLSEVPTVAESGLPGFDSNAWFGILVPAGTSPRIVNKINTAINAVLEQKEVVDRLRDLGMEPYSSTSASFEKVIRDDQARWARIVKDSGAKAD